VSEPEPKIHCPHCRAEHDPETNFCGRCGSDLRMRQSAVRRAVSESGAPSDGNSGQIDPLIGRLIDSRYRVISRLGHGGMGVVYKVEHQRMGKIAAMKVLHRELVADKEVVKRFRREAEAVSKLTHQNTVQTFDFGTSDGAMYLVMEYVRGEDLGTILKRDGAVRFRRAAPIFIQICNALAEAHELGIVHRDLKPENILVTRSKDGADHVKVLDFGLAKLSEREEAAEVTGRGTIIGTPYYMSPEQIRGETLDHRSDIYSLGALMYRMMTGEHPFVAQSPVGVLTKHLTDDLVPPRTRRPDLDIDPRVEAVVMRAMEKKREARHPTVDALRVDLERVVEELRTVEVSGRFDAAFASTTPVRMTRPPTERRGEDGSHVEPRLHREDFDAFERSLRRKGIARLLIVPTLLALAAGGVVYYLSWERSRPSSVEKEPNNTLEAATLIAAGHPVRGKIGRRIDDTQSDRDYYRVGGAKGRTRLRAELSSIRRMDLALALYDGSGKLLANADNVGRGEAELIPNLVWNGGDVFVAVTESRHVTDGPTENPTDEYTLGVTFTAIAAGDEVEPNDVDSDAQPLDATTPITGWLGRHRDVDRFRWQGEAGDWMVEVGGAEGVPVAIRVNDGDVTKDRKARVTLHKGDILIVERRDVDDRGGARPEAPGVGAAYTLALARAP
jgi:serine/threonine-protein kinase